MQTFLTGTTQTKVPQSVHASSCKLCITQQLCSALPIVWGTFHTRNIVYCCQYTDTTILLTFRSITMSVMCIFSAAVSNSAEAYDIIWALVCKTWRKSRRTRIVGVSTEVRTEYLPNSNQRLALDSGGYIMMYLYTSHHVTAWYICNFL
jgi:hypothetical protein